MTDSLTYLGIFAMVAWATITVLNNSERPVVVMLYVIFLTCIIILTKVAQICLLLNAIE